MKFNKPNNQLNIAEIEEDEPDNSIMVVDDSKFARNILCDILRNDGFHVVAEAKNGLEAVELTKEKKPKYIFLDVEMPMLDGLGAIPGILEADPEAHIIMCTAMGQKNIIVEAAKAGAKDYVIKPYKKENILRVLNVIIESKKKHVMTLKSDIEVDEKELPNQKQQVHSKQQDTEDKYVVPQSEKTEYKEPEYNEAKYIQQKYIEPGYIEPERIEPEHIEPEHIESEYIEPEHIEPEYIEPVYIDPEYIEAEYMPQKNEKLELKEELKPLSFKEEAEDAQGNVNEQGITAELEPEPKIQGDFIELLSLPQEADAIYEAGDSTSEMDVALPGEETAVSAVIEELVQNLPEQENADESICESSELSDTGVEEFILKEAELPETDKSESFPDTGNASETEVTESILDAEEASETEGILNAMEASETEGILNAMEASEPVEAVDTESILGVEEVSDSEETVELIEILGTEEDSELKFLLEAITDYDYCEGISDADTTGKTGAGKANHKPVRLRPVKEASNELVSDTVTDYYSYTYLWRNRFDTMPEDIPTRPVSEQRMPFHNVVQLKRNDSFLTDIDNSCNGILSGLASAYLGRKKRLQTDESGMSADKQANYYQDGARVFINTIMEDKSGDDADIAMSDLLILSEAKEQNIVKIQVKSLSDAVRQLVFRKAGRNLM